MPVSERAIESAIDSLKNSPGTFQRLVERYAYLTYPQQFKNLIPLGRSSSDVTVKGWPDAYSLSPNFMLNVVEVTHSPAWSRHLKEDLQKAEALGSRQLDGFLFVAWANEPSRLTVNTTKNPQHEQLVSYHKRLIALDIPPENINFVFKKQLVHALSQPRFANIVKEILGLRSHSSPFRTISGITEIFGTSGRYDFFAPSKEEYENGLVHRAAITNEVEKRLNSLGWAWLRGLGAAGKTVLAIHIGLAYESRSLPTYYLDLSETDVRVSDTLDVITTHADDGVLFIIDNVHLNQAFARDIFDHWNSVAVGSHLLLIGRDTTITNFRGTTSPLDGLRAEAQTLEVTQDDLKGVFLRLARRARNLTDSTLRPPNDALQRWHRLFGGDLIAFSAAVAHRLGRMGQCDWTIEAHDASTYVQEKYLGRASEAERLNLLRLAVLAQLELDAPKEALDITKVEAFLQNGLVHSVGRGPADRRPYYRLIHPGLGDLLLTAAGYSDQELKRFISNQFEDIAQRHPSTAACIAARLETAGRAQEATVILKHIVASENGLKQLLVTNEFQYFRPNTERLMRLGVLSGSELEDKLGPISPAVNNSASNAPLSQLAVLLGYTESRFSKFHNSLITELERPENAKKLSKRALHTELHNLAVFLDYTEGKLLRLYPSLIAALERPENVKLLQENALRTPVGDLVTFLKYTEQKLPGLYISLVAVLEQPQSVRGLTELTLRTPPHFLPAFLDYAKRKLPRLYNSVVRKLRRPESAKVLSESALRIPLADLAVFLEYAGRKLPRVSRAIKNKLTNPANISLLAETACHTPLDGLLHFLQTEPFGAAVVHAIDKNHWDKCRLGLMSEQLDAFPAAARMFQSLGRPDLGEAPAIALITVADQKQWNAHTVGLPHLSHVMRLGRAAGEEVIANFITSIAIPSWLNEKYNSTLTHVVASTLFSVWVHYEDSVLSRFNTATLKSRVRFELNSLSRTNAEQLLAALRLIGVCALIGARVGEINITWPNVDSVNEVVRLAAPVNQAETVSLSTIQLWLGLRVMAGLRSDQVYIQSDLGDLVLVCWKNSTVNTDKQNALDKSMICWMERCAKSGWILVADRQKVNVTGSKAPNRVA